MTTATQQGFAIGSRVQIRAGWTGAGRVGRVISEPTVRGGSGVTLSQLVRYEDGSAFDQYRHIEALQLPAPKFAVGDAVTRKTGSYAGKRAEVTRVYLDRAGVERFEVRFDQWHFGNYSARVIEPYVAPKPVAKFAVGDEVTSTDGLRKGRRAVVQNVSDQRYRLKFDHMDYVSGVSYDESDLTAYVEPELPVAKFAKFAIGDRVSTQFGNGTVTSIERQRDHAGNALSVAYAVAIDGLRTGGYYGDGKYLVSESLTKPYVQRFAVGDRVTRTDGGHAGRPATVRASRAGRVTIEFDHISIELTYPENALTEYVRPALAVGDVVERADVDRIAPRTVVVDSTREYLRRSHSGKWQTFHNAEQVADRYVSWPVTVVALNTY